MNNIILLIIIIIIFLVVHVLANEFIFRHYFTVNESPMTTFQSTLMYGSLGIYKPDNTKMNTSGDPAKYEDIKSKHQAIISVFGTVTYLLSALASYATIKLVKK